MAAFHLFPAGIAKAAPVIWTGRNAATPPGGVSPIAEPYPYISNGSFSGPIVSASPDPLIRYRWAAPKATDGLQIYLLKPEAVNTDSPSSFTNVDSLLTSMPNLTVNGPGTIRVDFGRENAAWLEFDSPDCPGGIQMSISEYNEPEYTNIGDKTVTPERIGNTYRAKFNAEYYEGVRFGFIHVNTFTRPWHITGIRLVCQVKPSNYEGSFSCSDPLLTQIWYNCAYTVKICNLKDFTTPILIERSDRFLWNGLDFYIYNSANLTAFKNYDFVRDQIIKVNTPPGINCGIPGFELYDVHGICDYFDYSGDTNFLDACHAMACEKLNRAHDRYASGGQGGGRQFMGWDERLGGFERVTSFNEWNYRLLCIRSWKEFARVMDRVGNLPDKDKYNGYAAAAISGLKSNATWYAQLDVHGCAEAIQAGICTPAEIAAMCEAEFSDRVNRVSFCQANTSLIMQGMARAGKYDDALCTLKDQWGATIKYGGTTTFEMFHPSAADALGTNDPPINGQCGMTSLCHPWGTLPCKYLNEEVLGIKPTTPGFETVDIVPHLGRWLTSVSGVTPTLKGNIAASFDVTLGKCHVALPSGVLGRVGIPKAEKTITSIKLNGSVVWDGTYHTVPNIGGANEDGDFVYFTSVHAGEYDFQVSYQGTTPSPEETNEIFPVKFVRQDANTHGNWGGVYGGDGYVLFNYDGVGKDVRSLPAYVSSVIADPERCANSVWATNTVSPRAPARDSRNSGMRTAASIYTKDPAPTYQTMFVDINLKTNRNYTLALYFVDWDNTTRRVGAQIIDLKTLKQLAPVEVVRSYHDGKYLVYQCDRSVRVRIDTIKKPNATLSGMFFSTE